jgi:pimeloyl-ACP methyl ester carboxylesterase
MAYIQSGDATLYYEECGCGDPLIVLPGLLCSIESHWRRFIPDLAKFFHTIAVDLRGHGKTNNPSGVFSLNTFVADLRTLYDTLQIDRAYLCGHDLGGLIALAYGIGYPETVRGLLMHATKVFWTEGSALSFLGALESPENPYHNDSPSASGENWNPLIRASHEFIELLPQETVAEAELARATFPVCVSIGDEDETIPRDEVERLVRALPRSSLVVLKDTRHSIHTVKKSEFVEHVRSFFLPEQTGQHPSTEKRSSV